MSSKASSAALASDYHNGRGTRDDRGPLRRTERICSQSQWEKEWERQKDRLVGDISKGNRRTDAVCELRGRKPQIRRAGKSLLSSPANFCPPAPPDLPFA